ncbi:MAG: GNAT family N-acetyltransferase [Acidovorax sp.]|jgi:GNAT superfamily N-acetyltransferase|nr:GNAT family N-acetyltransferase [Acidovorax sp.]
MGIHVRTATLHDAAAACVVLYRSITECCMADHGGDAAVLQAWLGNKTPEHIGRWIQHPHNLSFVAEVDGQRVGFALSTTGGEVLLCYALPEHRFTGVGKAMLAAMEAQARADGVDALRLDSTRTARAFYLRHGFVESAAPISAWGMTSYPMVKMCSHNEAAVAV